MRRAAVIGPLTSIEPVDRERVAAATATFEVHFRNEDS